MKKHNCLFGLATIVVAMGLSTLGCADDRPVYMDDGVAGTAGTAGHAGTSGNAGHSGTGGHDHWGTGGNAGHSGTGGTGGTGGNAGTGGSTSNLPGESRHEVWQVFSYNIYENDAYDQFSYYNAKGDDLIACTRSTSCMTAAMNDTAGRAFQFLYEGSYSETFNGMLKGFCVYRNGYCGEAVSFEAGYNCKDSNGYSRDCKVAGVLQMSETASGSPSGDLGPSQNIVVGFEYGDECRPVVFCFGAEHGLTFDDHGIRTMSYTTGTPIVTNTSSNVVQLKAGYKGLPK